MEQAMPLSKASLEDILKAYITGTIVKAWNDETITYKPVQPITIDGSGEWIIEDCTFSPIDEEAD